MGAAAATAEPVIEISHVATRFGEHVVHEDVDLQVLRGEIFALVGGSGSGKSTLLREMILLHKPEDLAAQHLEVHVLVHDVIAEARRHMADFDYRSGHGCFSAHFTDPGN